jgi:molecular chaperone GrpE (heat shock protein)
MDSMITKEIIQEQINELKLEQRRLQASHDELIREHQQRVEKTQQQANSNVVRMQQMIGAINQLTHLLNGEKDPNQERKEP